MESANLESANLESADLQDTSTMIIIGLKWLVIKYPTDMQIGCERHSYKDWRDFTEKQIESMGKGAWEFWSKYKDFLLKEV